MNSTRPTRLAIVISGRGSNVPSIVDAINVGQVNAELIAIYSNRHDAPGLDYARALTIPTRVIEHTDFASREAFDQALHEQLLQDDIELVALAGFMRILSEELVRRWLGRMINIHPSLLPAYPGLDTHARALAAGDRQAGASVHYVTPQLDGGPVIVQAVVNVEASDDTGKLSRRVLEAEQVIYPLALEWATAGRLEFRSGKCYLDQKIREQPVLWHEGQLLFDRTVPP